MAALLEDLLAQAYRIMPDWWADEADLQRAGWIPQTPHPGPTGEEGGG